jgi:hypothetical protein
LGVRGGVLTTLRPSLAKTRSKLAGKLPVPVADEEAQGLGRTILQLPTELACLLGDPGGGRVGRAAHEVQAARAEFDEEEDIQPLQEECVHREEAAGEELLPVLREEGAPGGAPAPGGGRQALSAQDPVRCGKSIRPRQQAMSTLNTPIRAARTVPR